ncbi:MAG: leucyl aminopeptidase [Acidobacteriia bacterium]|nr:leucyl aminopeptidase [Terriglobia bacterium]
MQTRLDRSPIAAIACDALIIPAFEEGAPVTGAACDEQIAAAHGSGECSGKEGEFVLLHGPRGLAAGRLLLVGCGKQALFTAADLRRAAGAGARHLKDKSIRNIALVPGLSGAAAVSAAVEGAILGDYEPDRLKTDPDKSKKRVESFILAVPGAPPEADAAFDRGIILAESQNFSRGLVNEPGNLMTPNELASQARMMSAEAGLECEVLDRERMQQLGMGSLLGVAIGSAEPPVLIIVRYRPEKASAATHLALVGKGVTFDTGGVSIKPADGMEKMKYDMAGGAAVLGAMRAIVKLKPSIAVTALVPAVENMSGSRAQRPGDIVTSLNGKTVEVLNTDAEGRLILIDAITYAQRLGCTHMVDAATLTGAIVVALGHVHVGAFTNNQEMLDRVLRTARAEGEKMWQMPLDDEYKEQLKSAFADLPNIGTRWGGSITAAYFLKEFADPTPWVHLDIAGTAWLDECKPHMAKGPTGVCVRTFTELALGWQ